jgi:peptide/nickel transport system substrate-binding protein
MKRTIFAVLGVAAFAQSAIAAEVVIAARTELAMDPHAQWLDTNTAYYNHIYGSLVRIDEKSSIVADLAESWKAISETEWIFNLRKNATFHDGSSFEARDVVASFNRVRSLKTATSPFTGAIATVKEIKDLDPYTISITTTRPDPVLLHAIANIQIVPSEKEAATTASFNASESVIGTGPYKFVSYKAGDQLVLERNAKYFGPPAKWDKVTFRFIPDDAARVAAMVGGNVDLVDFVPPRMANLLRNSANADLVTGDSDRPIFLIMDTERDDSPFVRDVAGQRMQKNPLKDRRVREALSLAIDRNALASRVMDGAAKPSSQPTAPGFGGYNADLKVPANDIQRARALLKEAGYDRGFQLTLHCTNDRYVNDERVCQTLGQMLSQIGITMSIETMPRSVFFPKATNHASDERFSFMLLGWGNSSTGDAGAVPNVIHSFDRGKGLGTWNLGHYSNAEVDRVIEEALSTMDLQKRYDGLARAVKMAMDDVALIPLYTQSVVMGIRKGMTYATWANERTNANSLGEKK